MITLEKTRISPSVPDRSITPLGMPSQRIGKAGLCPARASTRIPSPRMPTVVSQIATPPPSGVGCAMALVPARPVDEPQPGGELPHQQAKAGAREKSSDARPLATAASTTTSFEFIVSSIPGYEESLEEHRLERSDQ